MPTKNGTKTKDGLSHSERPSFALQKATFHNPICHLLKTYPAIKSNYKFHPLVAIFHKNKALPIIYLLHILFGSFSSL